MPPTRPALCLIFLLKAGAAAACPADVVALTGQGGPKIDGATCQQSLTLSGAASHVCHLSFEYRAPEAQGSFDRWSRLLLACAGAHNATLIDQPVNHPDSYTLHQFDLPQAHVSVSLKDKGALQKTLVFVQVIRR